MKIHDATNGKRVQCADYGDYIQYDDGLYQVRGDGHRKQIVKVQTPIYIFTLDELTDNTDECETCGTTAVCSTITVTDGDLIADYLACDNCRLIFTLSQMGRRSRGWVEQLRGGQHG